MRATSAPVQMASRAICTGAAGLLGQAEHRLEEVVIETHLRIQRVQLRHLLEGVEALVAPYWRTSESFFCSTKRLSFFW